MCRDMNRELMAKRLFLRENPTALDVYVRHTGSEFALEIQHYEVEGYVPNPGIKVDGEPGYYQLRHSGNFAQRKEVYRFTNPLQEEPSKMRVQRKGVIKELIVNRSEWVDIPEETLADVVKGGEWVYFSHGGGYNTC